MNALFHLFLLTFYNALGVFLVSESVEAAGGGTPLLQVLQIGAGLTSIVVIATNAEATANVKRAAPLLAICFLAFASAAWSVDPVLTMRRATTLLISFLLGFAIIGRLGPVEGLRLVIRSMALTCLLSAAVAIFDPLVGVHQASDAFQNVHAGLWRGVLNHKVSLGCFAGLTLALLIYFGSSSFATPLSWGGAIAAAVACLVGSGSATGLSTFLVLYGLLFISGWMGKLDERTRVHVVRCINAVLIIAAAVMFTGGIEKWAPMLGRSSDLTGRSTYWPFVESFINSTSPILGLGYCAGYKYVAVMVSYISGVFLTEAHNGVLELRVYFGNLGALFVMAIVIWYFVRSNKLLVNAASIAGAVSAFPFCFIFTNLFVSYAESIILNYNGIWTILFFVATAAIIHLEREAELYAAEDFASDEVYDSRQDALI